MCIEILRTGLLFPRQSIITTAVCSQYILVIICRSLLSIPISDRHSIIFESFYPIKNFGKVYKAYVDINP